MNIAQAITSVGVVLAIVTFISNSLSKKREESRAERELFETFNLRFDKLNEILNNIPAQSEWSSLNSNQQDAVQDYLNLCGEEYLWYKRGLIGQDIWSAWLAGIHHYLTFQPIVEHFADEKKKAQLSYYGLFSVLKNV